MLDSGGNRRDFLRLLAGGAALAAGSLQGEAAEARIARLIAQTRDFQPISRRIDFISAALRGARYRSYTLIGGPREPEKFVVRDDAFDCVTYCETVLAAARSQNTDEFENALREIRYRHGLVNWFERNHYFFEWCQHNVENNICRWLSMDGAVDIEKTVDSQKGLSKRHFVMRVIPRTILLAQKSTLESGDIIGFVSQRANLDYFHCAFVMVAPDGTPLLRHASLSHSCVLDQRLDRFLERYGVRYVTLVRPEQPAAAAARKG
jgi:N-acetylmuramoyl-L-alanine amidase-like